VPVSGWRCKINPSGRLTSHVIRSDAYIGVRVPNGPRPDGSILVYLADGTGLVVNSKQLLRFETPSPGQPRKDSHEDRRRRRRADRIKAVTHIRECGHEAVAATLDTGVDTLTGEGLAHPLVNAVAVNGRSGPRPQSWEVT
jgi:hypothetical protein